MSLHLHHHHHHPAAASGAGARTDDVVSVMSSSIESLDVHATRQAFAGRPGDPVTLGLQPANRSVGSAGASPNEASESRTWPNSFVSSVTTVRTASASPAPFRRSGGVISPSPSLVVSEYGAGSEGDQSDFSQFSPRSHDGMGMPSSLHHSLPERLVSSAGPGSGLPWGRQTSPAVSENGTLESESAGLAQSEFSDFSAVTSADPPPGLSRPTAAWVRVKLIRSGPVDDVMSSSTLTTDEVEEFLADCGVVDREPRRNHSDQNGSDTGGDSGEGEGDQPRAAVQAPLDLWSILEQAVKVIQKPLNFRTLPDDCVRLISAIFADERRKSAILHVFIGLILGQVIGIPLGMSFERRNVKVWSGTISVLRQSLVDTWEASGMIPSVL